MNHPTQNEWLLYLDGEASPENVARLQEHLEQCPTCAAEVAGWQRSAQKLRRMPFSPPREVRLRKPFRVSSFVKWGLAAAIVLFAGFAFGRFSALRAGSLERAVAARVHEDLKRELREDLLAALAPEPDVKDGFQNQLRVNMESALTRTNARLYRHVMEVMQQQRQQDQERLLTLIQDVRNQQISDTLALRRDLETAVATADSDLRQDSRRISQLANTLLTVQK